MNILQALILGLVQGATEFIPVSSSAHLVLVPWLLGWPEPGLSFDTIVHWGTLVAVLLVFWRDFVALVGAWLRGWQERDWSSPPARLAWWLILGTVPGVVLGLLLEDFFEALFSTPATVAGLLLVTAAILALSERLGRRTRDLETMTATDALLIGLGQACAIAPGISRSGATIAVGLLQGLKRDVAARFSFLLSTPIILGAGVLPLKDLLGTSGWTAQIPLLAVGFLAAAGSGYACIRFLLSFLQRGRLYGFAVYCALVGMGCLGWALLSSC